MAKNDISFVIPCYNEEKNIKACVESIIQEMHNYWGVNYEIIVVVNNWTDNTVKIAEELGCMIVHEPKKGVVWARQAGLKYATGTLVANIDADSMVCPGWYHTVTETFRENPKAQAVTGPLQFFDGSRTVNFMTRMFYKVAKVAHHTIGHSIQGGNCVIRRYAINKVGGYDTSYEFYGEDTRTASLIQKAFGRGSIIMNQTMIAYSSARRLKEQGHVKTTFMYIVNYVSTSLFNKPINRKYVDYR